MTRKELFSKIIICKRGKEVVFSGPYSDMGRLLKEIRKDVGYSQAGVAESMGSSQKNIWRVEHGNSKPSIPWIKRYLDACGNDFRIEIQ